MTNDWIDISVPLSSGMVRWPGDGEVNIERMSDMERGDGANLTHMSMSAHTGTHLDAPLHFMRDGAAIDRMPREAMIGPARLLHFPGSDVITADHLIQHEIRSGERILIKTNNSNERWYEQEFNEDFVHLGTDAAGWLAERRVRLVGIDYLSIAGFKRNETEVHNALLGAGVWILEGLDLSQLKPGLCELLCLPLRLAGADGAPARALARPIEDVRGGKEGV